ncbi:AIR carboxylase family protein [Candidatus Woesearchaeota archaeon]|nr:AIR carboxylase family protein [Candidatus Woesearchaeota archaeon]
MKTLVLFASKSDEETYTKISDELQQLGIEHELRIASAHKTPDKVEEIISGNYSLIISGAGLAAHLSGVIAAKKTVPVLGVWCAAAYDGLDSFLSIAQMPPGIPVLAVSKENAAAEAKKIIENMKNDKVAVTGEGKAADKCAAVLEELGMPFEMGNTAADAINIVFTEIGKAAEKKGELIIYCPVGETKAEDAIRAMRAAKHGLWVGVNMGENAAVAAAEIAGRDISDYRRKLAEKVKEADEEVRASA